MTNILNQILNFLGKQKRSYFLKALNLLGLFTLLSVYNCASNEQNTAPKLEIRHHYNSSDQLLQWFHTLELDSIEPLTQQPGNQIMEANVLGMFDTNDSVLSFKDELLIFKDSAQLVNSNYGIDLAYTQKENSTKLLNKIKSSPIKSSVIERAYQYFPHDYEIKSTANIYYVLTGWKFGDAYVRTVTHNNGQYSIASNGTPSILFNLSLYANRYKNDIEKQFVKISNVMSHELFHFMFSDYKSQSENYAPIANDDALSRLFDIIQNEGIGHYIDRKEDLKTSFETYQKHQETNFNKLSEVIKQLSTESISEDDKRTLVRRSNTGKYWSKYGAITGMFMAYHIEQQLGKEALTNTIKNGALSFIKTYITLQKQHKSLPLLDIENTLSDQ